MTKTIIDLETNETTTSYNPPETLGRPTVRELCIFLSEYAAWLLGSGATCIRLERNVKRIAQKFDTEAVMTIMPRHIHMTVCNEDRSESYTFITSIGCTTISFDINTKLSSLSWAIADGKVTFDEARHEFKSICHTPPTNPTLVRFLAAIANASFCRLFGGDLISMAVVFIAALAGFYIKQSLCEKKVDIRLVFIICAFVSSVLGSTCALFHLGATPGIAVGTSVLYLVPGIPFINSFSDMLAGHYISAFSRFMHAVILTASLSMGLFVGLMMMRIGMF